MVSLLVCFNQQIERITPNLRYSGRVYLGIETGNPAPRQAPIPPSKS